MVQEVWYIEQVQISLPFHASYYVKVEETGFFGISVSLIYFGYIIYSFQVGEKVVFVSGSLSHSEFILLNNSHLNSVRVSDVCWLSTRNTQNSRAPSDFFPS